MYRCFGNRSVSQLRAPIHRTVYFLCVAMQPLVRVMALDAKPVDVRLVRVVHVGAHLPCGQ